MADDSRKTVVVKSKVSLAPASQPRLVYMSGSQVGKNIDLEDEDVCIGREERCEIFIDSDQVSRRHAVVQSIAGRWYLRDLGSTNGTFVNGERVSEHTLNNGDGIRVGEAMLKYVEGDDIEAHYHQQVYSMMTADGLTGAMNKRAFEDNLDELIGKRGTLSLVLFDLDHFKRINDEHGHLAGDEVLRQVAATVHHELGEGELFARVGGEEFALLFPGLGLEDARGRAQAMLRAVAALGIGLEGATLSVTFSGGGAELEDGEGRDAFYARADAQLYAAKRAGRNRIC